MLSETGQRWIAKTTQTASPSEKRTAIVEGKPAKVGPAQAQVNRPSRLLAPATRPRISRRRTAASEIGAASSKLTVSKGVAVVRGDLSEKTGAANISAGKRVTNQGQADDFLEEK